MTAGTGVPAVAAGDGLRGVTGIQGWYRDAVADFVRHADTEGRENESVGVFLIEPHSVTRPAGEPVVSFMREVIWKARYLALENEEIAAGLGKRSFSVSPEQIENVWREAESRQKMFFRPLERLPIKGKRYHPLMGLGHSHPGGAIGVSEPDLRAFAAWKQMQDDLSGRDPGRITANGHFVYSFGALVDTLSMYDREGHQTASVQGNFVAAVQ